MQLVVQLAASVHVLLASRPALHSQLLKSIALAMVATVGLHFNPWAAPCR